MSGGKMGMRRPRPCGYPRTQAPAAPPLARTRVNGEEQAAVGAERKHVDVGARLAVQRVRGVRAAVKDRHAVAYGHKQRIRLWRKEQVTCALVAHAAQVGKAERVAAASGHRSGD